MTGHYCSCLRLRDAILNHHNNVGSCTLTWKRSLRYTYGRGRLLKQLHLVGNVLRVTERNTNLGDLQLTAQLCFSPHTQLPHKFLKTQFQLTSEFTCSSADQNPPQVPPTSLNTNRPDPPSGDMLLVRGVADCFGGIFHHSMSFSSSFLGPVGKREGARTLAAATGQPNRIAITIDMHSPSSFSAVLNRESSECSVSLFFSPALKDGSFILGNFLPCGKPRFGILLHLECCIIINCNSEPSKLIITLQETDFLF